jgi:hypothetical protein
MIPETRKRYYRRRSDVINYTVPVPGLLQSGTAPAFQIILVLDITA